MVAFEFILALAIVGSVGWGCSVSQDWKAKTIEERASKPRWVVYGIVISNHMPVSDTSLSIDQEYAVIVKPLCWLKKSSKAMQEDEEPQTMDTDGARFNKSDHYKVFENITVIESAPCTYNNLTRGKRYILFLETVADEEEEEDHFRLSDVNVQSGAFKEPTNEIIKAVHRGIDRGTKGSPRGRCVEGVEIPCFIEMPVPEDCNLAATIGVSLWSLVIGTAFAIKVGMTGY